MRFVLPLLLAVIGAGAGVGAGLFLKPAEEAAAHAEDAHGAETEQQSTLGEALDNHAADHAASVGHGEDDAHDPASGDSEFTKLNNQFVVPVLSDGKVKSMVVLSLSLETPIGKRELVYSREPRIRDTFLQVLFDHANIGGFDGEFTRGDKMDILRRELRFAAREVLGADIHDVLITDIARQDFG